MNAQTNVKTSGWVQEFKLSFYIISKAPSEVKWNRPFCFLTFTMHELSERAAVAWGWEAKKQSRLNASWKHHIELRKKAWLTGRRKKKPTSNIHVAFQQIHFYLIRRRRSPAFDKRALWQLIGVKAWNSEMSWRRMQRTFSQISVAPSYEVYSSLSLPTSQSQASGHTSSINVPDYERPPTAATKGLFHPLAEHDSIVQADVVTSPTQSLCPDVSLQIFGAVIVFLFCKVKPSSTCQQFTFAYSFFFHPCDSSWSPNC